MDLLGLSAAHSAVYRALLRRPGAVPLAPAGLSDDDVAGALRSLRDRGLLDGLVPVRPDAVLEPQLVDVEQGIATTRTAVLAARRELGDLVELYAGGLARSDRTVEVERVDGGRDAVQRRIDELVAALTGELLAVSPSCTPQDQRAEEAEQSRALVARGIRMRTLLGPAVHDSAGALRHALALQEVGDEQRVHPDPPLQMLLLDRRVAVVPLDPEASGDGALFVWSATLVRTLVTMYASLWQQARPLERAVDPGGLLGAREARLLALLAAGQKDETVARHLGVSVRTVRRESAVLMERLGAQTRFQAGVEAARRGWL